MGLLGVHLRYVEVYYQTVNDYSEPQLGGKDPVCVAPDADLDYTAAELVDGAFFNSGQSCCAIERTYVHEAVYDQFFAKYATPLPLHNGFALNFFQNYRLGDFTSADTNLGPVVSLGSAEKIRKQVADAIEQGAKALIPEDLFTAAKAGTAFVAPQALVDVSHTMDVMMENIPPNSRHPKSLLGLRNHLPHEYGLTTSVWTNVEANAASSEELFLKFVNELESGTVFLNRCDYLDPALSWVGVKDSGRGVRLSKIEYDQLTRPKSVHMKINTSP